MHRSLKSAIAHLTVGDDPKVHFDPAAERIQRALLDVSVPDASNIEIGVHAEPARLVGGDYIDLFLLGENALIIGLGDASGKSLAAALNALMLRYLVRGLANALGVEQLVSIVTHTNAVVTEDMSDGSFITFVLATLDVVSGTLRVVNAGHEPPLLYRHAANQVRTMDVHDIVLGVNNETSYKEEQASLGPGDIALLYTDGLTEATDANGELFTIERLKKELLRRADLPAQLLAETIFENVKQYASGELRDDATILVIRRLG